MNHGTVAGGIRSEGGSHDSGLSTSRSDKR